MVRGRVPTPPSPMRPPQLEDSGELEFETDETVEPGAGFETTLNDAASGPNRWPGRRAAARMRRWTAARERLPARARRFEAPHAASPHPAVRWEERASLPGHIPGEYEGMNPSPEASVDFPRRRAETAAHRVRERAGETRPALSPDPRWPALEPVPWNAPPQSAGPPAAPSADQPDGRHAREADVPPTGESWFRASRLSRVLLPPFPEGPIGGEEEPESQAAEPAGFPAAGHFAGGRVRFRAGEAPARTPARQFHPNVPEFDNCTAYGMADPPWPALPPARLQDEAGAAGLIDAEVRRERAEQEQRGY